MNHGDTPIDHLARVRGVMRDLGLDALIVRGTDRYLNEYVPHAESTREWLTGFTGSMGDALMSLVMLLPLVAFALGSLALLAWLSARTSVYTITDRRVVMRVGIVLSLTFNLPFKRIESAGLKLHKDGHGNIPLTLTGSERIAILHLWPHARPWRVNKPEPMLTCVPQAARVAGILQSAWTASVGDSAAATSRMTAAESPSGARIVNAGNTPQLAID
jgi:hypothetical protein